MIGRQPTERFLTDSRGVRFAFDSGATCLDFGYSGGTGRYAVYEVLYSPSDLQSWFAASDLALSDLEVDAPGLAAAKDLRAATWSVLTAVAVGSVLDGEALDSVNLYASAPPLTPRLGADGISWTSPTLSAALSSLAREAIELASAHGDRVRQCAADDCPLVFYDTSRSGQRRWCSMQRCGNRHKVRSHRARG